jgi:H/ACA ribonucleoprotein complex subunit 3
MRFLLKRCESCHRYTLNPECPVCGSETKSPHPPKFSLDDKYIRLRLRDAHRARQGSSKLVDQD